MTYGENKDVRKEDKDNHFKKSQKKIDEAKNQLVIMSKLNGLVGNKKGGKIKNTNGEGLLKWKTT